ncbi:MAG: hypothetical protein V4465_03100 [Patescibacteria group bacterium]
MSKVHTAIIALLAACPLYCRAHLTENGHIADHGWHIILFLIAILVSVWIILKKD